MNKTILLFLIISTVFSISCVQKTFTVQKNLGSLKKKSPNTKILLLPVNNPTEFYQISISATSNIVSVFTNNGSRCVEFIALEFNTLDLIHESKNLTSLLIESIYKYTKIEGKLIFRTYNSSAPSQDKVEYTMSGLIPDAFPTKKLAELSQCDFISFINIREFRKKINSSTYIPFWFGQKSLRTGLFIDFLIMDGQTGKIAMESHYLDDDHSTIQDSIENFRDDLNEAFIK